MRTQRDSSPLHDFRVRQVRCRFPGRPSGSVRDRVENSQPAWILDVALPEQEWIQVREVSKLVDGLFRSEGKRDIERRAQGLSLEVALARHTVIHQPHVRDAVHGAKSEWRDSLRGSQRPAGAWRSLILLSRGAERQLLGSFSPRPDMLGPVVLIRHDIAIGIDSSADLSEMSGAIVVPTVFVPAHELYPDRFPNRLRQNRGCFRRIIVATVAECSRPFVVLNSNFIDRYTKHLANFIAGEINVLRRAHDQRGVR